MSSERRVFLTRVTPVLEATPQRKLVWLNKIDRIWRPDAASADLCRQSRGDARHGVTGQNRVSASQEAEHSGRKFHSRDAFVGKPLHRWLGQAGWSERDQTPPRSPKPWLDGVGLGQKIATVKHLSQGTLG